MKYFVDGSWVSDKKAVIPVSDLSVQRGIALFESIRTYNGGNPFHIDLHIARLLAAAKDTNFTDLPSRHDILDVVESGIEKNYTAGELAIRIILTAGSGTIKSFGSSRLLVLFDELEVIPEAKYEAGLSLVSYSGPRFLADKKHTNYYSAALGLKIAEDQGADDILYKDNDTIYETATGNIFMVKDDQLVTTKDDILPGLTRGLVVEELAPIMNIHVSQRSISYDELLAADEVFITGSLKEIIGVTSIDGQSIGSESGEVTRELRKRYRQKATNS